MRNQHGKGNIMDLEILKPVYIGMNIEEVEMKRFPSIRMSTLIKAHHATGDLVYTSSNIWFKCEEWDLFTRDIRTIVSSEEGEVALLRSMSDELSLLVKMSDNRRSANFSINIDKRGLVSGKIKVSVCLDEIGKIANSFANIQFWK